MHRHPNFSEKILNDTNHHFSIKVVTGAKSHIDLYVSQSKIYEKLDEYIQNNPDHIRIYFSNSTIYAKIATELINNRSLNYFEKLRRLEVRIPHLYFSVIDILNNRGKSLEQILSAT